MEEDGKRMIALIMFLILFLSVLSILDGIFKASKFFLYAGFIGLVIFLIWISISPERTRIFLKFLNGSGNKRKKSLSGQQILNRLKKTDKQLAKDIWKI